MNDGKLLDTSAHYGADSDGTSSESDTKIGKFIILELEWSNWSLSEVRFMLQLDSKFHSYDISWS